MKKRQDMPGTDATIPPAEMQHTELQARQIDLETQIEELLQARDLLEESRDRYVDFYDFSPVGYITLSHKALITEINLTGAVMLGEECSQLRRRRFAEFLALEDNDFWNRHFMAARQHEGKLTCELSILRGDGSRIDVQIDSLRLARDSREPVVRLALTDITERKRAEAALRESEAQRRLLEQQKIIQTSLDGFWVARVEDARILEANESFCNMVGYAREELLTMSIYDLEAEEQPAETVAHIKRIMEVGYDRFETRQRHKQGHLIDLEVSVSYSELDGGVHFVFVRNITERKFTEQYERFRSHILELLSGGDLLPDILEGIVRGVEQLRPGMICSLLLLEGNRLCHGTAPSLPDFYNAAIEGVEIGIGVGSCGTAAASEERVIVADIQTHPYWASIKELAAKAGLGACWSQPIRSSTGQVLGTFAIYHHAAHTPTAFDISIIEQAAHLASIAIERKRMEESLVSRERELRALTESSPGMMGSFYLRPDGSMCMPYVTSKIWEHFGLTPQEVAVDATPLLARTHPDDAKMVQDSIAESAISLTTWHKEYRILHPTKGERWMESNTNPEPHPDGGVIWYGNVHDITERKVAEEALRTSEQQFRTLAENLPDILIRYDHEGRRTYVNPAQERLFSVTSKQTLGKTWEEDNPMNLSEAYQQALKHTLATGERSEFEMKVVAPSGEVRTGFICIAAERTEDGKISGAITIGRDITKLKQTEQQLRELTAHLQSVREEEKSHLAREIHDDLGSTLAALKLKLSYLLDSELAGEMKSSSLFAGLESMSFILANAIAATRRIITDMRPDVLDNLGLFAAIKWQAEQFQQSTGIECLVVCVHDQSCKDCKNCDYKLEPTPSINLFRIFQEALTNVARHSGAACVEAEYCPEADHVRLLIRDDGRGLPEGHVPATTSFGIRGMRERVAQLGGQITFDNALGGGLCVTVRLPFSAGNKGENPT
ncbi:MAG: PAS domain S-box protein [Gallionellaceae bacterium]|jgi:PAS domain S-box-containing protein